MARKLGFDFFFRLLSVEQVEPTVVEIVERSLEFCLLHLDNHHTLVMTLAYW